MSAPKQAQRSYVNIAPGDPAPLVTQSLGAGEAYPFHKTAGRYTVLCFYASAADPVGAAALEAAWERRGTLFDGKQCAFFGVCLDRGDDAHARLRPDLPVFRDFDGAIARAYGALPRDFDLKDKNVPARRLWVVLDPWLRVLKVFPFEGDGAEREQVFAYLEALPPPERSSGVELQAPVLFLPNVFEPALCARLVEAYETNGGSESGFMRELGGKTTMVMDPLHKRRRDYSIEDKALVDETKARVLRRIVPEIARAFQFQVTRMERFIVACYAADEDGHFNAHRDNTTKGTAHRRFAVSLNLNDDYEGGELTFPEYGPRGFKPPAGAAVVFSCSLLHQARLVTKGRRYAFLPFLYDEAAAAIREANNKFLDAGVGQYRSS
jgi:predicted 2-oxoglutarate/Fe(II)-dependent dioxygenase YbiX/peroxiredoxin